MFLSNAELKEIKSSLIFEDSKSFVNLLSSTCDIEIFKIIKEQKLILLYPKAEIITAYSNSALRLLNGEALEEELRYLQFISFYIEFKKKLIDKLDIVSKSFCTLSFSELLNEHNNIIDSFMKELEDNILFTNMPAFLEKMSLEEKGNYYEIVHNSLRGRQNDAVFALLRSLNTSQEVFLKTNDNSIKKNFADNVTNSLNISGFLNSLDYVHDNLSYGTCKISKIVNNKKPVFWLDFVDENYVKSREIGLRRMFTQKIIGSKRKSWLAESLIPIGIKAFEKAWNYYKNDNFKSNEFLNIKEELEKELEQLDVEDELLVSFGADNNIKHLYIKSVVILAYITAMNYFNSDDFPIKQVKENLKSIFVDGECIGDDIDFTITKLPVKNHIDLLLKPLLVSHTDSIHLIKYIASNHWVQWARNSCMKGGTIADKVGKAWEKFAEYTFEKNNWNIIGSAIEIKQGKNKITDIDLLVEMDNIIFIIQMKTFYTLDYNEYSQWKSKEKLRKAAKQLNAVNLSLIKEQLSKIGKDISANKIIPLILTNLHIYNGWDCDGARVVSFGSLSQFFNGANVEVVTIDGEILSSKKFMNLNVPIVNEFIEFIENPLDWRIANSTIKMSHHELEFENFIVQIPVIKDFDLI